MAKRDENRIPTIQVVSDTDGETLINLQADPTSHALDVDNNTTGSDNGPADAARDENRIPIAMAVSSADGVTPVALYANSSNCLLIDST